MNKVEAMKILETITAAYPTFELTEKRIELWGAFLDDMDYEPVLHRLKDYIADKRFPPTISEIAVKPPVKNGHLEQVRRWEREAKRDRKHRG